ncbi:hypothetical protein DIPPA_33932 [Diplonema papillatum]|nr:hypothetical protein DIPPA_33932 [Diplonema papillatum]
MPAAEGATARWDRTSEWLVQQWDDAERRACRRRALEGGPPAVLPVRFRRVEPPHRGSQQGAAEQPVAPAADEPGDTRGRFRVRVAPTAFSPPPERRGGLEVIDLGSCCTDDSDQDSAPGTDDFRASKTPTTASPRSLLAPLEPAASPEASPVAADPEPPPPPAAGLLWKHRAEDTVRRLFELAREPFSSEQRAWVGGVVARLPPAWQHEAQVLLEEDPVWVPGECLCRTFALLQDKSGRFLGPFRLISSAKVFVNGVETSSDRLFASQDPNSSPKRQYWVTGFARAMHKGSLLNTTEPPTPVRIEVARSLVIESGLWSGKWFCSRLHQNWYRICLSALDRVSRIDGNPGLSTASLHPALDALQQAHAIARPLPGREGLDSDDGENANADTGSEPDELDPGRMALEALVFQGARLYSERPATEVMGAYMDLRRRRQHLRSMTPSLPRSQSADSTPATRPADFLSHPESCIQPGAPNRLGPPPQLKPQASQNFSLDEEDAGLRLCLRGALPKRTLALAAPWALTADELAEFALRFSPDGAADHCVLNYRLFCGTAVISVHDLIARSGAARGPSASSSPADAAAGKGGDESYFFVGLVFSVAHRAMQLAVLTFRRFSVQAVDTTDPASGGVAIFPTGPARPPGVSASSSLLGPHDEHCFPLPHVGPSPRRSRGQPGPPASRRPRIILPIFCPKTEARYPEVPRKSAPAEQLGGDARPATRVANSQPQAGGGLPHKRAGPPTTGPAAEPEVSHSHARRARRLGVPLRLSIPGKADAATTHSSKACRLEKEGGRRAIFAKEAADAAATTTTTTPLGNPSKGGRLEKEGGRLAIFAKKAGESPPGKRGQQPPPVKARERPQPEAPKQREQPPPPPPASRSPDKRRAQAKERTPAAAAAAAAAKEPTSPGASSSGPALHKRGKAGWVKDGPAAARHAAVAPAGGSPHLSASHPPPDATRRAKEQSMSQSRESAASDALLHSPGKRGVPSAKESAARRGAVAYSVKDPPPGSTAHPKLKEKSMSQSREPAVPSASDALLHSPGKRGVPGAKESAAPAARRGALATSPRDAPSGFAVNLSHLKPREKASVDAARSNRPAPVPAAARRPELPPGPARPALPPPSKRRASPRDASPNRKRPHHAHAEVPDARQKPKLPHQQPSAQSKPHAKQQTPAGDLYFAVKPSGASTSQPTRRPSSVAVQVPRTTIILSDDDDDEPSRQGAGEKRPTGSSVSASVSPSDPPRGRKRKASGPESGSDDTPSVVRKRKAHEMESSTFPIAGSSRPASEAALSRTKPVQAQVYRIVDPPQVCQEPHSETSNRAAELESGTSINTDSSHPDPVSEASHPGTEPAPVQLVGVVKPPQICQEPPPETSSRKASEGSGTSINTDSSHPESEASLTGTEPALVQLVSVVEPPRACKELPPKTSNRKAGVLKSGTSVNIDSGHHASEAELNNIEPELAEPAVIDVDSYHLPSPEWSDFSVLSGGSPAGDSADPTVAVGNGSSSISNISCTEDTGLRGPSTHDSSNEAANKGEGNAAGNSDAGANGAAARSLADEEDAARSNGATADGTADNDASDGKKEPTPKLEEGGDAQPTKAAAKEARSEAPFVGTSHTLGATGHGNGAAGGDEDQETEGPPTAPSTPAANRALREATGNGTAGEGEESEDPSTVPAPPAAKKARCEKPLVQLTDNGTAGGEESEAPSTAPTPPTAKKTQIEISQRRVLENGTAGEGEKSEPPSTASTPPTEKKARSEKSLHKVTEDGTAGEGEESEDPSTVPTIPTAKNARSEKSLPTVTENGTAGEGEESRAPSTAPTPPTAKKARSGRSKRKVPENGSAGEGEKSESPSTASTPPTAKKARSEKSLHKVTENGTVGDREESEAPSTVPTPAAVKKPRPDRNEASQRKAASRVLPRGSALPPTLAISPSLRNDAGGVFVGSVPVAHYSPAFPPGRPHILFTHRVDECWDELMYKYRIGCGNRMAVVAIKTRADFEFSVRSHFQWATVLVVDKDLCSGFYPGADAVNAFLQTLSYRHIVVDLCPSSDGWHSATPQHLWSLIFNLPFDAVHVLVPALYLTSERVVHISEMLYLQHEVETVLSDPAASSEAKVDSFKDFRRRHIVYGT